MGWVMHDVLTSLCQEGLTCNLRVGITLLRYTLTPPPGWPRWVSLPEACHALLAKKGTLTELDRTHFRPWKWPQFHLCRGRFGVVMPNMQFGA